MKSYAMRFISGKYQGGEFPLPGNAEIVVGRSSDLDMVLVEDMVSRRHAKILVRGAQVSIQDLGSTNGTFVNGERIKHAELKDGDRVLIGTSIIKLVGADAASAHHTFTSGRPLQEVAENRRGQVRSMSGAIDDVPLPDLLQLFGSSRKTGILVIKTDTDEGKIYLEQGMIVSATINDLKAAPPERAVFRILAWQHGAFYMEPAEEGDFPHDIQLSAEGALMEGLRIYDEVMRFNLPPMRSQIACPIPFEAPLRDLSPEELDVLQIAMGLDQLEAVFNNCEHGDLVVGKALSRLIGGRYIEVSAPQADQ